MKSEEKLHGILIDIYREAYSKAEPVADFDKLRENGETKKPWFFHNYHLDDDIQNEIIEKHIKKNKLRPSEADRVRISAHLGCLPCSCEYTNPKHKRRDNP